MIADVFYFLSPVWAVNGNCWVQWMKATKRCNVFNWHILQHIILRQCIYITLGSGLYLGRNEGQIWGLLWVQTLDLSNSRVTAVLCEISCYIAPCYNNTQLYLPPSAEESYPLANGSIHCFAWVFMHLCGSPSRLYVTEHPLICTKYQADFFPININSWHCNVVFHWLSPYSEWSLYSITTDISRRRSRYSCEWLPRIISVGYLWLFVSQRRDLMILYFTLRSYTDKRTEGSAEFADTKEDRKLSIILHKIDCHEKLIKGTQVKNSFDKREMFMFYVCPAFRGVPHAVEIYHHGEHTVLNAIN